ncbi:MAG: tRNA pseudouridine(55) synthase TruB [Deltaproteobacteria bacterium]|nr:tRNA pseudouridine(55) synthase TruB [Deltaproteobacteria bacterium]
MDGIIAIDKPVGMTSAQVVATVKRATRAAKVGHTGTLDPFATGVLVCCLNRATRLASFFLHGDKGYEGEMLLGVETDTQDPTGRVIRQVEDVSVSNAAIEEAFSRYRGVISQEPPVYSALKHEGVPLYKLARAGTPVQKPARTVTIHELSVKRIDLPRVSFFTRCSGGTYVRALVSDIGRDLGVGAHLARLRRTENSGFTLNDAISLEELSRLIADGQLHTRVTGMNAALRFMPQVRADAALTQAVMTGRKLTRQDLPGEAGAMTGNIKITDEAGRLLAVISADPEGTFFSYSCVLVGPDAAAADRKRRFNHSETRNQKEARQSGSHP